MECIHHTDATAIAICTRCDVPLCESCVEERNGKRFCADCASYLEQRRSGYSPPHLSAESNSRESGSEHPTTTNGVAGEVYEGVVSGEEVYQGPSPGEDVYQGSAPGGDVYQGPPPGGDLHGGPAPVASDWAAGSRGASAGGESVNLFQALFFGGGGAILAVLIWYQVAVWTGKEFGFLALLVGALVGFGCRVGAGGSSDRVAAAAVGLFLVAMVIGEFLIVKYFVEDYVSDPTVFYQEAYGIDYDCDFTLDEVQMILEAEDEEWEAIGPGGRREWVQTIEEECRTETSPETATETEIASFGFGEYLGGIFGYFGFTGLIFLFIGSAEAYQIAGGGEE